MVKRKIFILLTKFSDVGAKILTAVTGFDYTHASIGLEEDLNTFYSFVNKGFIVEQPTRYIRPGREPFPCLLYELEVSCEIYNSIKALLRKFTENKRFLRYTRVGIALCLLHIPYKKKHRYFCSQFVAEVLECGKIPLKKDSSLYLPADFGTLPGIKLNFQGNLQSMVNFFDLSPTMDFCF